MEVKIIELKDILIKEISNHLELINMVAKGSKEERALVSDLTRLVNSVKGLQKMEYVCKENKNEQIF